MAFLIISASHEKIHL